MKRLIAFIFAALLAAGAWAHEYEATVNGVTWYYNLISDGNGGYNAEITYRGYSSSSYSNEYSGSLVIPTTLGGYSVKSIGRYAFSGCSSLTSVTIPEGVTTIGERAFDGCESLTSVTIPEGVTTIGLYAFDKCYSLTSIDIPSSVTDLGGGLFSRCSELRHVGLSDNATYKLEGDYIIRKSDGLLVTCCSPSARSSVIPDGVTAIGSCAFCGTAMSVLTIPNSVTKINRYAFNGYIPIYNLTIPDSVVEIADHAFDNMVPLQSITIGTGLKKVGDKAFYGTTELERINIKDVDKWAQIDFAGGDANPLCVTGNVVHSKELRCNGELVTEFKPSNQLKSIGAYAFYGYDKLTKAVIPSSVESIGVGAFLKCKNLAGVDFEDSDRAYSAMFAGSSSLPFPSTTKITGNGMAIESVTIPDNVTGIGTIFRNNSNIKSVRIGSGVEQLEPNAFSGCSSLQSVTLSEGLKFVGTGAFSACSALQKVEIPSSVTNISYGAFEYCTDLREVILHEGLEVIRSGAFMNCSKLATINIPSTVQQIGGQPYSATFEDCPLLGDEGVVIIDNCVIKVNGDCPDTVVLPKGTRVIADKAFGGKAGLKEIVIPDGVICIGEGAFSSTGLTAVYLPDSVKYVGAEAFSSCKTLKSVRLPKELTAIAEDLFAYCNMLQEVTIPDSVTSIGNYAFYNCTKLTSIVIGKKVESIGSEAFENCTSLVALDIPNSVTALGYNVGFHCSNLKKLKIGSGVTTIPTHAFDECYNLQEIILGRNVAYIDQYAFYNRGCYQTFICRGTNVYWTSYATWGSRTIKTEIQEPSVTKGAAEITAKEDGGYSVVTSDLTAKISIPDDVDDDQVSFVIYRNSYDIAPYLSFHRDGYGIFDLSAAVVKPEIVKEAMDPEKGAEIELSAENPTLTTSETKPGLTYTLFEGATLESMANGDSKLGDGTKWSPKITVKGGASGFYTIRVTK